MPSFLDISGHKYGRLTVIKFAGVKDTRTMWLCSCECGNECTTSSNALRRGNTKSCGCLAQDNRTKHGLSYDPLYPIWRGMMDRCYDPRHKSFPDYGGRGVTVCERWKTLSHFVTDMSPKPKGGTLGRIDNNGHYEPDNCRWETVSEQGKNKRNNRLLTFNGKTQCLSKWCEELNIPRSRLARRLDYGWSHEKALTTGLYNRE